MTRRVLAAPVLALVGVVALASAAGAHPAPPLSLVVDHEAITTTSESATTTAADTTTTTTERLPGTSLEAEERDDGTTSAAPWIIGSGVAALAVVGIGGLLLKRRAG